MSRDTLQQSSLQRDYISAYHASKLVWYELRTDDELYRIADREQYVEAQVGAQFPHIDRSDLARLGNLANQSVIELINNK